jgi:hypothetical protein
MIKDVIGTQEILDLIKEYHEIAGKMKEYREEFV